MTSAPIEGRGSTIHQLFNGHRYQLDYYQREYTWGSENVRRLVEDLHRRFSAEWNALHDRRDTSRYKPYFLGPYVYFQNGEITYLVDGQQRVTTLHLLLIHIRNLLVDHDAPGEARQLETLICNVMYGERRYTIDIAERAPLPGALMSGKAYEVNREDPPSVRNLWERYGDLDEQFPPDLAGEALPYFHDWLLHRVCLVGIEAHDQSHGWEIFETMNDRGLQLSPVDLLKSFLLARSEQTRPRRLNETWRKAMTGLSALGGMGAATDFVKALLVGRYADPRDADGLARIESSFHEWFLHRSDNASYRDEPYSAKVEYYRGQNLLAASLHPATHKRNPAFSRFLKRYDLADLTRAYPADFNDKAILTRQDLYRRLCEIIWDPARLGFSIPATRRITGQAGRARAHYGVDIPRLMSAGLVKAGDTLVAVHRGDEHQAIVLDDGRIKLAGGEPFTSLSSAAAYARRTKTANGWEFWHLQTRRERRPLKELRDELIRAER